MQFSDPFRSRLIKQLMKSISRVLQNLLRSFNDTISLTFFLTLLPVWYVSFSLRINDLALALPGFRSTISLSLLATGTSSWNCHNIADAFD